MNRHHRYRSLSKATAGLMQRGFNSHFRLNNGKMQDIFTGRIYDFDDMTLVEHHRFEGIPSGGESSVIFALKTNDGNKGIIVSTYGIYLQRDLINFLQQVKVAERNNAVN